MLRPPASLKNASIDLLVVGSLALVAGGYLLNAGTLVVVGLLALLVGLFVVASDGGDEAAPARTTDDPLEELRDRYARGELSDEAFERGVERLLGTGSRWEAREYLRGRGESDDENATADRERSLERE